MIEAWLPSVQKSEARVFRGMGEAAAQAIRALYADGTVAVCLAARFLWSFTTSKAAIMFWSGRAWQTRAAWVTSLQIAEEVSRDLAA